MSTLKTYQSKTSNKLFRFVPEAIMFWYQDTDTTKYRCSVCRDSFGDKSLIVEHYAIKHQDITQEYTTITKPFLKMLITDLFTDLDKEASKDSHLKLDSTDYPHVSKQLILKRKFTSQTVSYIVPKEAETFVIRIGVDFCCTLCLTHYKEPLFDHIQREHPTVYKAFKQANPDAPDIALYPLTELFDVVDPSVQKKESDPVNHPSHYTFGKYEVLPVLMDWFPDQPLLWQMVKYLSRAKHKGAYLQDLKKAEFYLKRAIENAENETSNSN